MKVLKIIVGAFALLLVVGGAAIGIVYSKSDASFARPFEVRDYDIPFASTATAVEQGRHIFITRGCTDCHGADGGGKMIIDEFPVGHLGGANLTRGQGGIAEDFGIVDFEKALRHGVAQGKRGLIFMPSNEFAAFGDNEVHDLWAYVSTLTPVDRQLPVELGPLMRVLYLQGEVPAVPAELIDHSAAPVTQSPQPATTVEFGAHLANGCLGCHGHDFSGGPIPGAPPDWPMARNLTPDATGLAGWTETDFSNAMRMGKRPDGTELNKIMPWEAFSHLTDTEVSALWLYLQTLPAKPAGAK